MLTSTAWLAGRYLPEYHEAKGSRDFFECCRNPEVASTLTLQPVDRYAGLLDAAIIFSDILVIPQAMGMVVEMVDKKGPHFPNPLQSPADAQYKAVMERPVKVADELDYVYKAITLTRRKLAGRVPLIGFCGAPWTLFCYMVEGGGTKLFAQSRTWIYRHPEETRKLLLKIADICVDHLALQVKAGAQVRSRLPLSCRATLLSVADEPFTLRCLRWSWSLTHGRVSWAPRHIASFQSPILRTLQRHSPSDSRAWASTAFP